MGRHFLLQGSFLTQGSNPRLLHLLHWQVGSLPLSHLGGPIAKLSITKKKTEKKGKKRKESFKDAQRSPPERAEWRQNAVAAELTPLQS